MGSRPPPGAARRELPSAGTCQPDSLGQRCRVRRGAGDPGGQGGSAGGYLDQAEPGRLAGCPAEPAGVSFAPADGRQAGAMTRAEAAGGNQDRGGPLPHRLAKKPAGAAMPVSATSWSTSPSITSSPSSPSRFKPHLSAGRTRQAPADPPAHSCRRVAQQGHGTWPGGRRCSGSACLHCDAGDSPDRRRRQRAGRQSATDIRSPSAARSPVSGWPGHEPADQPTAPEI